MIINMDIVGIGNRSVNKPKFKMENLDEYLSISKKMISALAPSIKYGLAEEMLCNEDAISNVAHDIMMADWQFNGNGSRFGFRKSRAKYSIKSYLSRRAKNNKRMIFRLDKSISSSDGDKYFSELLVDKADPPAKTVEDRDYEEFVLKNLEDMSNRGRLSKKGLRYIKMYYLEGLSVAEIAKKESVTRQAVNDTISRTMEIIKNRFKRQLI